MRGMGCLMARCGLRSFLSSAAFLLVLGLAAMAQPGREPPAGFPGGPFEPPKPGEILPRFVQQRLALTPAQEKQVSGLQKDVDARLAKILTVEQKKTLADRPTFGPFGGPGGFPPGRGPAGGFQTVRVDEIKRAIAATEEEWKVIGPKLQKVVATRQVLASETRGGDTQDVAPGKGKAEEAAGLDRPGSREARRPPLDGRGGPAEGNAITQAHADFKAVLEDPKHTKAQLQEAAEDVRKARETIRANMRSLQKDLRQLLTADQEMILVGLGYLD